MRGRTSWRTDMQMPIRVRRIVGSADKAEKLRLEAGQIVGKAVLTFG